MPIIKNKNKRVDGAVLVKQPTHSRHIEEQGTQYESHTASTGARQPFHPVVQAATRASDQEMD